jgi:hypothetical protein
MGVGRASGTALTVLAAAIALVGKGRTNAAAFKTFWIQKVQIRGYNSLIYATVATRTIRADALLRAVSGPDPQLAQKAALRMTVVTATGVGGVRGVDAAGRHGTPRTIHDAWIGRRGAIGVGDGGRRILRRLFLSRQRRKIRRHKQHQQPGQHRSHFRPPCLRCLPSFPHSPIRQKANAANSRIGEGGENTPDELAYRGEIASSPRLAAVENVFLPYPARILKLLGRNEPSLVVENARKTP